MYLRLTKVCNAEGILWCTVVVPLLKLSRVGFFAPVHQLPQQGSVQLTAPLMFLIHL